MIKRARKSRPFCVQNAVSALAETALVLSFFSEVVNSKALRRLMLSLFTHTCDYKHDDGYHVGKHLEELLCFGAESLNIVIRIAESTEEECADYSHRGLPKREDNKCDCHPSSIAEGVVRPNARSIGHNVLKSAESCDGTTDTGSNVSVSCNVYACGVCCCRVLADRAEIESYSCAIEHKGHNDCDCYCKVGHKVVGEKQLSEPSQIVRKGKLYREEGACLCEGDGRKLALCDAYERSSEEVTESDTECGECKTSNVLISVESYGQETVDKTHEH